ncbi:MAG: glycosyltransferase [Coriobacteriia bacterium]|nr:glycosyltransferase [Coriobacteriia bacterium]
MPIQLTRTQVTPDSGSRNARSFVSVAVALCFLVLVAVTVLVLDWTTALSLIGGGLLVGLGAVWPTLWLAAAVKSRSERRVNATAQSAPPSTPTGLPTIFSGAPVRLTVLVPARNEASVIGGMVSQLIAQTHADFQALIIANNCTDDTAAVARRAAAGDARIEVLEATFERGVKADALNFALPQATGDAIVQLDADNVVEPSFLKSIAEAFFDPETQAVQTAIRASNVEAGILPHLQDVEFQVYSDVFNAGRAAIGRTSSIGGTGFAIRTPLIREFGGWSRHLVEDFELHLRLARAGIKVGYLGSAVVFDEKPATWGALINQRRRWIRGHVSLALSPRSASGLPLLEAIYLYSPLGIALSLALLCLGYAAAMAPGLLPPFAYLSPIFWLASILATGVMLFFVTRSRGHKVGLFSLLAYLLLFGFHWVVVLFAALLPASWAKTKTVHGRDARRGLAGYLGVDGMRSGAVLVATLVLAGLWLTPLVGAVASPEVRAHMLSPIQAPDASTVAVMSVVESAEAAGRASLTGTVVSATNGNPIKSAALTLSRGKLHYHATSNSHGTFLITVSRPGTYAFTAAKSGYLRGSCSVHLGSGESVRVMVMLSKQHSGVIYIVPVPY